MDTLDLMISVCEKSGIYGEAEVTTSSLAKLLFVSQQTISNELKRLEKEALISRKPTNSGIKVSLTQKGRETLKEYFLKLEKILKSLSSIKGKVFSGLGEGRFYVMQKGYKKQFISKLDIDPYEGTLNLKVSPSQAKKFLLGKKSVPIEGFFAKKRSFGPLLSFPVKIKGIKAAIIIPQRTHHKDDTIEIIAQQYLRDKLGIKDGDEVIISV